MGGCLACRRDVYIFYVSRHLLYYQVVKYIPSRAQLRRSARQIRQCRIHRPSAQRRDPIDSLEHRRPCHRRLVALRARHGELIAFGILNVVHIIAHLHVTRQIGRCEQLVHFVQHCLRLIVSPRRLRNVD